MSKIFSDEGIIFRFLSRMADYMWLGILTVIGCIPIVTVAVSFSTLFYCCKKIANKEDAHVTDTFIVAYKNNLKKGFLLSLIMLAVGAVAVGDLAIMFYSEELVGIKIDVPSILKIFLLVLMLLLTMVGVHICPLQATFENSVKGTLKNALFISITNFPGTILIMILYLVPFAVVYFFPNWLIPVLLFGFSVPYHISVYLYKGIFKKFGYEMKTGEDSE